MVIKRWSALAIFVICLLYDLRANQSGLLDGRIGHVRRQLLRRVKPCKHDDAAAQRKHGRIGEIAERGRETVAQITGAIGRVRADPSNPVLVPELADDDVCGAGLHMLASSALNESIKRL